MMGGVGTLYGHWHSLFPRHPIYALPCWLADQHAKAGGCVEGKLGTHDGEMAC